MQIVKFVALAKPPEVGAETAVAGGPEQSDLTA